MVEEAVTTPGVSRPVAALILLAFLAVAVTCMMLPAISFFEMIGRISSKANSILINKGVYYLFGGGLALSILLVDGVYNTLLRRKIPEKIKKIVSIIALSGLALVVTLPLAVHHLSAYVLEKRDYEVCESASSQWLFVRDIVYTRPGVCD